MSQEVYFIVLTEQRSGSTYLGSLLNQHPEILFGGELFLQQQHPGCWIMTDNIAVDEVIGGDFSSFVGFRGLTKPLDTIRAKGFVIHGHQAASRLADFEKISNIKDLKVINLVRQNSLARHVSQLVAAKTNAYQKTAETEDQKPTVWVNYNNLLNDMNTIKDRKNHFRSYFKTDSILDITYEDITDNPKESLKKIYNFLHLPVTEQSLVTDTHIKKQETRSLSEVVDNFSSIKQLLTEAGYSWAQNL